MAEFRNLTEIRLAYVTGNESLMAIHKRTGIPRQVIEEACKREGWVQQRKDHREELVKRTIDRMAAAKSKQIEKELKTTQEAADLMSGHLLEVLQRQDAFLRYDNAGREYYDARAMSDAARAIKDTIAAIRNIYGLPTVQETANMLNATRRLDLEQRKADLNDGDEDGKGGGVVELAPVVEGEA